MPIDEQKLDRDFILQGQGTAAELLEGLARAALLEDKMKARTRALRRYALVALLAGVALFILNPLFTVIGVVAAIALFVKSFFVPTVSKERLELPALILNMLNQDAGSRGRFDLTVTLLGTPEKLAEGPTPNRPGSKQTVMKDSWFTLSGRLSDGTIVEQAIADLTRQRVRRNARGKTKTKVRKSALIRLRLSYKAALYGDLSVTAKHVVNPFRLPKGTKLKGALPTSKNLTIKALVSEPVAPANLHASSEALLLGAYRILNLSRKRVATHKGTK